MRPARPVYHPQGTRLLILGVVAVLGCMVLGPVVRERAYRALREADARGEVLLNREDLVRARRLGQLATDGMRWAAALIGVAIVASVVAVLVVG